jgi:TatD DNase family protein
MYSTVSDQEAAFKFQLELATEFSLPLFLHCRGASTRFLNILSTTFMGQPVRGVVHCYTEEDLPLLREYVGLGLYVGFMGWICDPRRGLGMEGVVRAVPSDRYMVETDAPFLAPRNRPGASGSRTCEPQDVVWVVKRIAEWRGQEPEIIAKDSTENARRLFSIVQRHKLEK